MLIEELGFHHKTLLSERLKRSSTCLSQYSFATLYLFRKVHEYRLIQTDSNIYISGKTYDGKNFIMPTTRPRESNIAELVMLAAEHDFIFPVPQEWLEDLAPYQSQADYNEDDSDYIYFCEKLATYKGQAMHAKKNLLNQFLKLYRPQAKPLTNQLMADARDVLEDWQSQAGEPPEQTDYFACHEALDKYDDMILCGGIYYADNEPAGFILGEELRDDCFALHFAKGKKKFKGIYQYMYNHFAQILPKKYLTVNFEEDLGKEALRHFKQSYNPDRMLAKYRVRIRS